MLSASALLGGARVVGAWALGGTTMTWRYDYWISQLQLRDAEMMQLGVIALALFAAWEGLRWTPPALARLLRPLYLCGGLALFFGTILISYFATGGKP
jgi:hypothetical protein